MIHVVATIDVVTGQRAAFLEAFHNLMPHVHAEDGCVEYGPTLDVDTDISANSPREDSVVVIEKWSSLEALRAHLSAQHMVEFRENHGSLIENISIQVLESA